MRDAANGCTLRSATVVLSAAAATTAAPPCARRRRSPVRTRSRCVRDGRSDRDNNNNNISVVLRQTTTMTTSRPPNQQLLLDADASPPSPPPPPPPPPSKDHCAGAHAPYYYYYSFILLLLNVIHTTDWVCSPFGCVCVRGILCVRRVYSINIYIYVCGMWYTFIYIPAVRGDTYVAGVDSPRLG